jgi:hypothetical protein
MTDELERLKKQAQDLGLTFHHRAGVKKLRSLIDEHIAKGEIPVMATTAEQNPPKRGTVVPMTEVEFRRKQQQEAKQNVASLVRVRIMCMNPQKKNWQGEFISVGSARLGTFKRFVPFNGVEWHIPKIMYDMMKERKCTVFIDGKDGRGHPTKIPKMIDEFSIEVLEPLSPEELENLARTQAARAGQG